MRKKILLFFLLFFVFFNSTRVGAQEETPIGLFVYNFCKLFDWPESSKSGDFIIQVIGHVSVYEELSKLTNGKKIGNQNIVIQSISSPDQIKQDCQILFIGHWQSRHVPAILSKVGNNPTLLISEMEGLLEQGTAINFVIRDNKMVFEVNSRNVSRNQIKIDPRIRELAYRVID